ncbi:serine hydrolase [Limnohabitans sp. 63ED37-2]|uniref:serine hydrolase n=1 Tax=Limnohabitans sp. 63ED37-2 TaxID=1678128 RepID=UPI000705A96F|nr:serine hydrolase [Limnohabitans sp. 63ED37-2]ALK88340.1 Beta-lactamase [Limnohabitans sp. 63ED37-2]
MNLRTKNLLVLGLTSLAIFYGGAALAQNNKGQIESDQFWADFSKGLEWLPTSKSISAAPTPSTLEVAPDSLNSSLTPVVDQAFDPDVHRIVILSHKRSIIHRKYNEKWVNDKSRPSSASMAKSLTALAVGKAICSGAIGHVDENASVYASRLRGTSWGNARIRHLLAMSSGSNKPVFSPTGSPTPQVQAETLAKSYQGKMTHDFISLMTKADEKYSASGQQGLYNNLDTQALAILVEDATRQKFIEFFEREIWHAIGASQGGSWSHNSLGQVAAFSGFTAHPYDWIRLGHYVLEERAKDTCFGKFLKEATIRQSQVLLPNGSAAYGFQTWLGCGGVDTFCFLGHGGQRLQMSPSTGLVMYVHATSLSASQPLVAMYRNVASRYPK